MPNENRLVIEAAANNTTRDLAKVNGTAYSGNAIKQGWSGLDLIVDLSGMEIAEQIPLLLSHWNDPGARLGVVEAYIEDNALMIRGGIDTATDEGREIVEKGKKFEWQLSIGADIIASEQMHEDEERTVNGKQFKGAHLVVTKSLLREVSVVAVGADSATYMRIAASFKNQIKEKGANMDPTKDKPENKDIKAAATITEAEKAAAIEAARAAETARITAINGLTGDFPEIREKAISAGWTEDYTKNVIEAAKSFAKKNPPTGNNIIIHNGPAIDAKALEAALCLKVGVNEKTIEASCGQKALELADSHLRGISLKEVMVEAARLENKPVGIGFDNDTIKAAFSTATLPGILGNVANKRSLQAFTAQECIAKRVCRAGDLTDFKVSEHYRMNALGDLELVPEGGELKHGALGEDKATNKLNTYGQIFTLTREMIYNDDLGAFLRIPVAMGMKAARKIDQLFFTRLLANPTQGDGKTLFHADHKNYRSGANTALGVDSLEAAIALFMQQTDANGDPIAISPKFLLVPSNLYPLAQRLTMSALLVGGSALEASGNVIANYNLTPLGSPYLNNSAYTGHSDTGFYLFADPNQCDTFEIGYLNGKYAPTVEQGAVDFNTLGIGFRCFFDVGVREQGHEGMNFTKGKA